MATKADPDVLAANRALVAALQRAHRAGEVQARELGPEVRAVPKGSEFTLKRLAADEWQVLYRDQPVIIVSKSVAVAIATRHYDWRALARGELRRRRQQEEKKR